MLPKSKRLTKTDFKGLRARISYRGAHFDIATVPEKKTKYACVIAKKRIRRAVDRNKVRRKVYEAARLAEPSSPSYILVYPTKQALAAPLQAIREELKAAFATL
jgi:ribonuclease P protein component